MYDDLEALILAGGDGWALQRALAPLDEKARTNLSAAVQKLYRQLYNGEPGANASERLRAYLGPTRPSFTSRDFAATWGRRHGKISNLAMLAVFAVGPVSALRKPEFNWGWYDQHKLALLDRIIRDRRPEWIDDWLASHLQHEGRSVGFHTLRGWIRDDVCAKPEVDGYYQLFAAYLMRTGFNRKDEPTPPPLSAQLLADPDLLADVEGLFRVESIAFNTNAWLKNGAAPDYETWAEALVKLSAEGHLDRAALLQSALEGLTRDLKQNQLSGFHGFYKQMKPNPTEMLRHQPLYVDLLCHPVGHVAKFALEMLAELEKKGVLDTPLVLRELPTIFASDAKGNAIAALKLLKRIVAREERHRLAALAIVGEALRHANPEVQALALDILGADPSLIDAELLAALRTMEPFVAASNRPRFTQLLVAAGGAPAPGGVPAQEAGAPAAEAMDYHPMSAGAFAGPILRPEDRIEPIKSVDALIEAVFHAVETVDSPDEVERIIDAISRLSADRPADFDARVAPLLHRMKAAHAPNSIVLGSLGLGGALLNVLYTWLTGRLHRIGGEELAYYRLEEAFLPMRAHLGEVAERVSRRQARSPLCTPTHKGGWIDPEVWIGRLVKLHDPSIIDTMDFRLSLLRLAPDQRATALDRASTLPEPLQRVAAFALGGDARPTAADRARHAVWITAARCRDPFRDWSADFAPLALDDALPGGVRPARYLWRSSHTAHRYDKTRLKIPKFSISVACQTSPEPVLATKPSGLFGRLTKVLGSAPAKRPIDWQQLPTVAVNRKLENTRYYSGELRTPWVSQWLGFLWPQNPAAACMRGVMMLMLRTDDNSSSWSPSQGYFQVLFQQGRPWGEPGHLLLCVGLIGKDADARGLAVDATIEGIENRTFDPGLFAAAMTGLADGEWVKLNRLGDALMQIIQASNLHASVISEALQTWLPRLDLQQNNAARLLEVLVEAQALTGKSLGREARETLGTVKGTGKLAKIAKQLAH